MTEPDLGARVHAALRALGLSPAAIDEMTPEQQSEALKGSNPPEEDADQPADAEADVVDDDDGDDDDDVSAESEPEQVLTADDFEQMTDDEKMAVGDLQTPAENAAIVASGEYSESEVANMTDAEQDEAWDELVADYNEDPSLLPEPTESEEAETEAENSNGLDANGELPESDDGDTDDGDILSDEDDGEDDDGGPEDSDGDGISDEAEDETAFDEFSRRNDAEDAAKEAQENEEAEADAIDFKNVERDDEEWTEVGSDGVRIGNSHSWKGDEESGAARHLDGLNTHLKGSDAETVIDRDGYRNTVSSSSSTEDYSSESSSVTSVGGSGASTSSDHSSENTLTGTRVDTSSGASIGPDGFRQHASNERVVDDPDGSGSRVTRDNSMTSVGPNGVGTQASSYERIVESDGSSTVNQAASHLGADRGGLSVGTSHRNVAVDEQGNESSSAHGLDLDAELDSFALTGSGAFSAGPVDVEASGDIEVGFDGLRASGEAGGASGGFHLDAPVFPTPVFAPAPTVEEPTLPPPPPPPDEVFDAVGDALDDGADDAGDGFDDAAQAGNDLADDGQDAVDDFFS